MMFYKLRLKLTLINVSIILLLFLLLTAGTYYYSRGEIVRRSEAISNRLLANIQTGIIHDLPLRNGPPVPPMLTGPSSPRRDIPPDVPPGPNFFFVKTTSSGEILSHSSNLPLIAAELTLLVKDALRENKLQGTVYIGKSEYPYQRALLEQEAGFIILFQDFTRENDLLRIQLTALTFTGLICLILSFFGSFFMAHRAMIPIQTAWRQQKDFLSDASHELRTPLTVIQTNLDVVMTNHMETVASQTKWLNNIQEESVNMTKIVDSLLFLARADSNQQLLDMQLFSLNHALVQAATPFEPLAAAKDITIELSAKTALTSYGDEMRIKQVICILIDNAIRHTSSGGKISIQLSQVNKETLLTVTDSGEGIEAKHIDKIFDRFYQVDTSRSKGGSGLGLAIAKLIIENHHGYIQVSSCPGAGTTFIIHLP
jgi:signal transduction histidine kinase